MRMTAVMGWQVRQWFFLACLSVAGLTGLSGCASSPGGGGDRTDMVTDSDEPEGRKRARIRLELAVGYFEQGQAKVALDEIKRALIADPDFVDAYSLRGLVYMQLNDLGLAEDSFRRALNINPQDANVQHNYGWMLCQQNRHAESMQLFTRAIANPLYGRRARTWLAQGLCQIQAGQLIDAEHSLRKSYELDAGNPITGFNLAALLLRRGDVERAQFYIRRINNSEQANAESLWLGIRIEQRLNNRDGVEQLAAQLKKRYPQSRELDAFERGAFNE